MTISIWILGDQLIEEHPAILFAEKEYNRNEICILMIESDRAARRLPYHKNKLVLIYSAMRHYAEMLEANGYSVDYRASKYYLAGLKQHINHYQPEQLIMMSSSNFRGQAFQRSLATRFDIDTKLLPNTQFLTNQYSLFSDAHSMSIKSQEGFYRAMRRELNILITPNGNPVGGQWNYDKQNRRALSKDIEIPEIIKFQRDAISQSVVDHLNRKNLGFGTDDGFDLAVDRQNAQIATDDFFRHRLPGFGTYEDAMMDSQNVLFHSKLSPYLNIGLLRPIEIVKTAEKYYREGHVEINAVEGFIRQVIGWREYMYWQYLRLMPDLADQNFWQAERSLPKYFWNASTDIYCLGRVLQRALETGYAHHIERLMILSNFCLLTEIQPNAVVDWFMAVFIDAYDWVMIPNVVGMGLYADGGQVGTKPYIASANYINKMSNFCKYCRYDHRKRTGESACPFNFLYWHFLIKHEQTLRKNYRMARMLYNLKHLDQAEQKSVCGAAERFLSHTL